jgi:hypothetical protein
VGDLSNQNSCGLFQFVILFNKNAEVLEFADLLGDLHDSSYECLTPVIDLNLCVQMNFVCRTK